MRIQFATAKNLVTSLASRAGEIKAMVFDLEGSMSVTEAFESFMANDFESACDSSTKASWGGSGYSVELFEDGHYRVLWDNQIGNLYDSPGLILGIPALGDDDWDEDPSIRFYDNAGEEMREKFQMHWDANAATQDVIAFQSID